MTGASLLFTHGAKGFLVLGAVFLCATGAEALYADMGHFGPYPIRVSWYGLVLPALVLNYAGQTATIIEGPLPEGANPFYLFTEAQREILAALNLMNVGDLARSIINIG